MKVGLFGTCNGSKWREELIPRLEEIGVDYFDPVVSDWNEEAQKREIEERQNCDFCLYVITPKMTGVYSIAEVVDDSNKRSTKTIFVVLEKDEDDTFTTHQMKSLKQVGKMVHNNGGFWFESMDELIKFLE